MADTFQCVGGVAIVPKRRSPKCALDMPAAKLAAQIYTSGKISKNSAVKTALVQAGKYSREELESHPDLDSIVRRLIDRMNKILKIDFDLPSGG